MGVVIIIDFCFRKLFFFKSFHRRPIPVYVCLAWDAVRPTPKWGISSSKSWMDVRDVAWSPSPRAEWPGSGDASEQLGPAFLHCRQSARGGPRGVRRLLRRHRRALPWRRRAKPRVVPRNSGALRGHKIVVSCVCFMVIDRVVVSGSANRTISMW
jgi:hypothetical protein